MRILGKVIEGHHVGGKIGFPTINVQVNVDLQFGVYACRVLINEKWMKGALHYGHRPAFDDESVSLEIHILDFEGDLYGETVEIEVYNKLRDITGFSSTEALSQQIARDVEQVRQMDM